MEKELKNKLTLTIKSANAMKKDDLSSYLRIQSSSTNARVLSADSHLAIALKAMPFELKDTAIPVRVLNAETVESKRTSDGHQREIPSKQEDRKIPNMMKSRDEYKSVWNLINSYFHKQEGMRNADIMNATVSIQKRMESEKKAMYHLERAAEGGNPQAQNILANILVSGILPFEDHPDLRRSDDSSGTLDVQADFAEGGEQLARAIILWHASAMDGNVEAAIALGHRHFISATSGSDKNRIITEAMMEPGYSSTSPKQNKKGKVMTHSPLDSSHYGVLGTCESSLAYYEAAAHSIMDELETSPLRGKVTPARDHHKLAEIHQRGTSSRLAHHNKPDELDEAVTYYKMRANKPQNPDINAAYKVAHMYHYGLRGVKQDMREALKYYEIGGNLNSWEAGGQAGKFHLWGMGLDDDERNIKKALAYFRRGTPGGVAGCKSRLKKKLSIKEKHVEDDDIWDSEERMYNCDHPCVNGMGLLSLYGVPMMVSTNLTLAIEYFELAKSMGNMDAYFNLAMMKLGWMNPFYGSAFEIANDRAKGIDITKKVNNPSRSDYLEALELLKRADQMGHIQAKHRLGMIYSSGVKIKDLVVIPPNCPRALAQYIDIANTGTTIPKRMRTAYKQFTAGDYEASLRNYIAAAESGSVEAQVNAAFLFEQGFCLGMSRLNCMKASVRMWRAAARQGDEEACLRVGDFYYYGRLREETNTESVFGGNTERDIDYSVAPLPFIRYIIYPEDLILIIRKFGIEGIRSILSKVSSFSDSSTLRRLEEDGICSNNADGDRPSCTKKSNMIVEAGEEQKEHFEIAAHYYRKAADDHSSARANFNLGFMHEWGLGLTQDFPLAKRFYDIAAENQSGEAELAVQIALISMNIHEFVVKISLTIQKWYLEKLFERSDAGKDSGMEPGAFFDGNKKRFQGIILHHVLAIDTLLILFLLLLLSVIIQKRLNRQ